MNKKQAVQAVLDTIELSFSHRVLEQTVSNHGFVNADTCEWCIECIHHEPLTHHASCIRWYADELAEKAFYRLYGHNAEHSILGQWWKFEDKTSLRVPQVVEKIRRSYKVGLESLHWCKKHQTFSSSTDRDGKGYCNVCDDEYWQREQDLENMHREAKKQISMFSTRFDELEMQQIGS
jgi:hypothetical protein